MDAVRMWEQFGVEGEYETWCFGADADRLAELVFVGKKTATSSAYPIYVEENAPLPKVGEYSIILDSHRNAVCIVRTTKVYIVPFNEVSPYHAYREGEGDLSLEYWREVHREFFIKEMNAIDKKFDEKMKVVCEEFEKVFPRR